MKKKLIITALISAALLCGCGEEKPEPTPTPEPTPVITAEPKPTATPVTGEVHYDSPIVGQWIPIGVDGNGYMLFTEDGKVVRYVAPTQTEAAVTNEWRYELVDEDTFRMINEENVYSDEFDFEVKDDNQVLVVYDMGSGIKMGSEFIRMPE